MTAVYYGTVGRPSEEVLIGRTLSEHTARQRPDSIRLVCQRGYVTVAYGLGR